MNQKKTRKSKPKTKNQINQTQPSQNPKTARTNQNKPNKRGRKPSNPPRSKAIREYTAGGIVYRYHQGELQILLLQDLKDRWSIAKGHVESGETPEQTALREVSEETGLKDLKIISKLDKIHFFYRMNGKLIFMTTFVFLIEALGDTDALQTEEDAPWIVDVAWFDADKACEILEYKATRALLQEAVRRLRAKSHV